ncbi:HAD superfamily hydrolase (TIGR01509 family) [Paenibacillus phyllosphaerae]|uniref:HAD superfamily hydrolase (TIGR01509 family) n=1 Tax=Paenibacillus phyllosphaerae TaxID=274593 RepID=A0A7W5B1X8_9BACL|nr:HAD family hydrolase [Paenibacillus phyllosphaerae]MBB3112742.1 HAD superfamily hydrolase (TIGR01509 family) [Paenibacillus phyllosphaerae]
MIRAIVFDFDGLIFDTETPEFRSFQEMYTEHGHTLDVQIWGQWVGTDGSAFNPYDHLETCCGRSLDREALRSMRRAKYEQFVAEEQLRPGVVEYLHAAKEMGLKIGLASSSTREWVMKYLDRFDLTGHFDCIRVRDDVAKVKPDPELYLQVIEAFGIAPHEAIAFEDSPNGARAAKQAGLYCVTIPNDVTRELPFGPYDLRLQSMAERPLAEVVAELGRVK